MKFPSFKEALLKSRARLQKVRPGSEQVEEKPKPFSEQLGDFDAAKDWRTNVVNPASPDATDEKSDIPLSVGDLLASSTTPSPRQRWRPGFRAAVIRVRKIGQQQQQPAGEDVEKKEDKVEESSVVSTDNADEQKPPQRGRQFVGRLFVRPSSTTASSRDDVDVPVDAALVPPPDLESTTKRG